MFRNPDYRKGQKVVTTKEVISKTGAVLQKGSKGTIREVMNIGFVIEVKAKLWWVAPYEVEPR